jgi:integrase
MRDYPNLKIDRVKNAAGEIVEYYRHRVTGRRYGTDREHALRLWAADQHALQGSAGRARMRGDVASALKDFRESNVWATIAKSTRTLWALYLTDLEDALGELALQSVDRAVGTAWLEAVAAQRGVPSAQNARRAANRFWSWARARGMVTTDPPFDFEDGARSTKARAIAKKPIWRREQLDEFLNAKRIVDVGGNPTKIKSQHYRTEALPDDMRLAVMLGFYTAQRLGDILSLNASQISVDKAGRWWIGAPGGAEFRQEKTGARVAIPLNSALREELLRQEITPGDDRPLLQTESGGVFDIAHFKRKFRVWRAAAGLHSLTFRALRSSAMVALAEAGASAPEIASVSGHSIARTQSILDVYIPKTSKLAENAITAFEKSATWTPPLPDAVQPPRGARAVSLKPSRALPNPDQRRRPRRGSPK